MDRKTIGIGALAISALVLMFACIFDQPARGQAAGNVVKDRDYQMVTVPVQTGGDALYIVDNRTGRMGIFVYNVNMRNLRPVAGQYVPDAFR